VLDKSPAGCKNPRMTTFRIAPAAAALTLAGAALLAACSGGERPARRASREASPCGALPASIAAPAVREYLKLQQDPYPQRFLVAASTDSALPEQGVLALQDKGPTYFFPPDTALRAQVRAKLAEVGTYHTLLVAWKGLEQPDAEHAVVRLGGTYIGASSEGKVAPVRTIRFTCDSTGWRFDRADEEQRS
jgi:hypothetical protein